jgi:hypothetical protein
MAETKRETERSASPPRRSLQALWERIFSRPALAVARRARRAAEKYERQFGAPPPAREVESFEAGHAAGQRHADTSEAFRTGFRAGASEEQRSRVAGVRR